MDPGQKPIYHFEDIEVDAVRGRLRRGDEEAHLRQKAFSVLVCLLENRDRVVSKNELIDQVWCGTAVVDDVLVQSIKDIRRALGDDPHRPRFIRTIPKLGYRFISPVVEDLSGTTTTHIEEITRVELEIEEDPGHATKGIAATLVSRLKDVMASPRPGLVLPIAAVVAVSAVGGLIRVGQTLTGTTSTANAAAHSMTDNPDALRYFTLGVEKAQATHTQEAIEYLQKAVELDPEFAMAHARIGYVYAVMWGRSEEGKPYLERASTLGYRLTEKDKLHVAAWTAIADHDFAAAIPPLRDIINKFPDETEAYWRLGRVLTGEGQHEDAVAVLKQGLAVDPHAKDIYNFLGGLTSQLGRHDEAIALQQRYVELARGEPNAYDSLGMAYQHSGRYAEAAAQYQRALDLKPDFGVALAHFANTRYQQGRYNEAIELYLKYVAIGPSNLEKARGYARISIINGRGQNFSEADRMAQLARAHNEGEYAALILALSRGDRAAAKKLEEQLFSSPRYSARGVRNDSRIKFYLRGLIALEKGQSGEALENFRQIRHYLPPTWDLMDFEDSLGLAYLELGQFDLGIREFQRVLEINPQYPLAHFHIARAFEQSGQSELARQNYRRFLEVWKDADADIPEVISARKSLAH
jgi:tetratricopeptide (TPR) repeat protein